MKQITYFTQESIILFAEMWINFYNNILYFNAYSEQENGNEPPYINMANRPPVKGKHYF